MIKNAWLKGALATALIVTPLSAANACGQPSERWYRDVSDIIFDGTALCDPEGETCRIRVSRTIKNPLFLAVEGKSIDIDYYSWRDEYYAKNPNRIVLACGVPEFKPEDTRFRARFYANLDEDTQELVVRRYLIKDNRVLN